MAEPPSVYEVSLVTGDGCDGVDWEEPSYDAALASVAETAAQHAQNVGEPVFISDAVDGQGILYTITGDATSPIRTEFRYHIRRLTAE